MTRPQLYPVWEMLIQHRAGSGRNVVPLYLFFGFEKGFHVSDEGLRDLGRDYKLSTQHARNIPDRPVVWRPGPLPRSGFLLTEIKQLAIGEVHADPIAGIDWTYVLLLVASLALAGSAIGILFFVM